MVEQDPRCGVMTTLISASTAMSRRWLMLPSFAIFILLTSLFCLVWVGVGITRAEMQPNTAKVIIDQLKRSELAAISCAAVTALAATLIAYGLIVPYTKRLGIPLRFTIAFGVSALCSVSGFLLCLTLKMQRISMINFLYDSIVGFVSRA